MSDSGSMPPRRKDMHLVTIGLSLAAGLHAALLGAWKDSPFESFKPGSFCRELFLAALVGVALCRVDRLASPFLISLTAFTLTRIVTEFYKMFLRRDRQDIYRIPTQVHWVGHVFTNTSVRIALGLCWVGGIYGVYALITLLPADWPPHLLAPAGGSLMGLALAIGGGYKDGSVTRFELRKFVRSPINGAIGGVIVAAHTAGLPFLVAGAIACERMLTELFFKVMRSGYVGGHFMSTVPAFPAWMQRRRYLFVPYLFTWALFVVLWVAGQRRLS
jgi:hypothetical protein